MTDWCSAILCKTSEVKVTSMLGADAETSCHMRWLTADSNSRAIETRRLSLLSSAIDISYSLSPCSSVTVSATSRRRVDSRRWTSAETDQVVGPSLDISPLRRSHPSVHIEDPSASDHIMTRPTYSPWTARPSGYRRARRNETRGFENVCLSVRVSEHYHRRASLNHCQQQKTAKTPSDALPKQEHSNQDRYPQRYQHGRGA